MNITFTGIDKFTSLEALSTLIKSSKHSIEIGFLLSTTHLGKVNKYPTMDWISSNVTLFPRTCLHVCGKMALSMLEDHLLKDITNHVQRIQINGTFSIDQVSNICSLYPNHMIITQHNSNNLPLVNVPNTNHSILIDNSGGRGISPDKWNDVVTHKPLGFSGGLNPSNINEEWNKIKPLFKPNSWLDMESGVRTDDKFDIQKINNILSSL